ncbi:MAG: sulfite exporter TauE/SafE family protein [Actinomycetes bacterium]
MIESLDVWLAVGGLLAGLMVGLTGMGGAVLVTPLLILVFGLPPAVAVSSDVVANAIIKPVGSIVHVRTRTVHWGLVQWLSLGSVPGILLGTIVFARALSDPASAAQLKYIIGIVLLIALAASVVRPWIVRLRRSDVEVVAPDDPRRGPMAPIKRVLTLAVGFVVGIIVGMTSVGSGSLIVISLLVLYPLLAPRVLVGTDLTQAVPMLAAGALAHMTIGDVDWRVTGALLVGQIPGVWLGARMSSRYDGRLLKALLMVVLAATALKLLGVATVICGTIAIAGVVVLVIQFIRERAAARVAQDVS